MNTKSILTLLTAFTTFCFVASSPVTCQGADVTAPPVKKSFPVGPGGKLLVDADRGNIQITTGASEVTVEVRRVVTRLKAAKAQQLLDAHEVTFSQDGNRVQVSARLQTDFLKALQSGGNLQVEYIISIPKSFHLELKTAAGNITCGDVDGNIKARTSGGSLKFGAVGGTYEGLTAAGNIDLASASGTVNVSTSGGSIRLGDVGSDTRAATSAGNIMVKNARAKLTAKTSGGSIEADELFGPTQLETAAGSIRVNVSHARLNAATSGGSISLSDLRSAVEGHTSAGSITATFSAQPDGDSRLSTSGGSIIVRLDSELAFDLDAHASGGRVTTDIPITSTVLGEAKSGVLNGKINNGSKALVLKTSAGNISIQKK